MNSNGYYPLGRDTVSTVRHWDDIAEVIAPAPSLFRGALPRKSLNLSPFRNTRYRNQLRGTCVGQSGAAMGETTIRTPVPLDASSPPNPAIDLSPLWVYSVAREFSRSQGVRLGGDGAIVGHALLAVKERGFVGWDAWPCTRENELAYRDGVVPKSALDAPKLMPIQDVRRLTEADQILEYLAAGYSVWAGLPWRGGTATRADGYFEWRGRSVGGHAVELLGYDLDADAVWVGNSWDGWGLRPAGVGYTRWSAFAADLTSKALDNGTAEACVVAELDGWQPKVKSWYDAF